MLGRASGGPAPDDHAGNVTIENAEPTEPGSFNQLGWELLGAGDKMLHVASVPAKTISEFISTQRMPKWQVVSAWASSLPRRTAIKTWGMRARTRTR